MAFRIGFPNFSKGEIAPDLYGRFDVDAYSSSARKARNVMVLKYGGLTKRPGTRFVAEVRDATEPVRLLPFQFSFEQTYALEMGQGYMRVASGGGMVLNEELAITAITNAANAQISAAFHGYSVGDEVFLSGIAGDLGDYLNNRFWTVASVVNGGAFTIAADTTGKGVFTAATGGITRVAEPAPDPVAPAVPPPVTPPDPPVTGGGGRPLGPGENVP
ncbi:MAG: hypothetical protein A3H25_02810 [Sphingomonadales bacterium RIFCSPLOWO2_12_FULL_63_15]|nr:MAG: hypothetical protein A3H25_02810 [Sphingomonadales bacterium RIFCSPLOWO2_12_FULL_63_15]